MKAYILYLLIPLILFGVFYLAMLFIKKYFDARKMRYSSESNYPLIRISLVLLAAFLAVSPVSPVLELVVYLFKKVFNIQLEITSTVSIYNVILFVIFCMAIVAVFYIYYSRLRTTLETEKFSEMTKKKQISFPPAPEPESPIFNERMRELFTLKYRRHNLELEYDSKDKILYGEYWDGLHKFVLVLYCDDCVDEKTVSVQEKERVCKKISKDIAPNLMTFDDKTILKIYYLLEKGHFEGSSSENMLTLTEDEVVNQLVDFSRYLEELRYKYKNDKLFSAKTAEGEKFTLLETFVKPSFNNNQENLDEYIDDWLLESGLKHLVILGDYGMGKSSFLKFYSAKLAEEILEGKAVKRFPVFISLTNTSPRHGGIKKSVDSFVSQKLGVDSELFQKLVYRGKILFILDGFDEMGFIGTHQQRFDQFNAIWQLATQNNKILIAGRPSYFPTEFEMENTLNLKGKDSQSTQVLPFCESLTLDKFDLERIEESIKKYYGSAPACIEYLSFIKSNKSISDLCSRPSMMHIIREMLPLIHTKFKDDTLTPGQLMEQYVNYWIDRQESKCIVGALGENSQEKKTFITNFFRELAAELYLKDDLLIPSKALRDKIRAKISALDFKDDDSKQGFETEIFTGYFVEIEGNDYKFVHKSFFEYFVAQKIAEQIGAKNLKSKLMKKSWTSEIVDYAYDLVNNTNKDNSRRKAPSFLHLANSRMQAGFEVAFFKTTGIVFMLAKKYFSVYFLCCLVILPNLLVMHSSSWNFIDIALLMLAYLMLLPVTVTLLLIVKNVTFVKSKTFAKSSRFSLKSFEIAFQKGEMEVSSYLLSYILDYNTGILKNLSGIHLSKAIVSTFAAFREMKLLNVVFSNCDLRNCYFIGSSLKNVHFKDSLLKQSFFSRCKFINVNFSHVNFGNRYDFGFKSLPLSILGETKIKFIDIKEPDMDENTKISLKKAIVRNKLNIGTNVVGDEWLMEELKKIEVEDSSAE